MRHLLQHYFKAATIYNVHSPFVYTFCKAVLEDKRFFYCFAEVETLREQLSRDFRSIPVVDLGAGSKVDQSKERQISKIVKYSVSAPVSCRWLFRIAQLYKPKTIVELGTSFGISTLYLSAGAPKARLITIEGAPSIFQLACQHFKRYQYGQIEAKLGTFDEELPRALEALGQLDLAYIDGNHTEAATWHYFQLCLKHHHAQSILIFDDIHWSREMERVWKRICDHPKVRLSIDLYQKGIVFFNPQIEEKQHFKLIPYRWKPWKFGWI